MCVTWVLGEGMCYKHIFATRFICKLRLKAKHSGFCWPCLLSKHIIIHPGPIFPTTYWTSAIPHDSTCPWIHAYQRKSESWQLAFKRSWFSCLVYLFCIHWKDFLLTWHVSPSPWGVSLKLLINPSFSCGFNPHDSNVLFIREESTFHVPGTIHAKPSLMLLQEQYMLIFTYM